METILLEGGEGLIARKSCSQYQPGRSDSLLKFKAVRDNDARIIAVSGNEYTCQLPTGASFVTSLVFQAAQFVKVDDVVAYKCAKFTKSGLPVRAAIYRVRYDVTWEDVLASNSRYGSSTGGTATASQHKHQHGYWTKSSQENMRKFLDGFAKDKGLAPFSFGDWCKVTRADIFHAGGRGLLAHYGSLPAAVLALYPEIATNNDPPTKWKTSYVALRGKTDPISE